MKRRTNPYRSKRAQNAEELLEVHNVKHVEQEAFEGGVSHRGLLLLVIVVKMYALTSAAGGMSLN